MSDKTETQSSDSVDGQGSFKETLKQVFKKKGSKSSESGAPLLEDQESESGGVQIATVKDENKQNLNSVVQEGASKQDPEPVEEPDARIHFTPADYKAFIEKEAHKKAMALLDELKKTHGEGSHSAYKMDNKKRGTALIFNNGQFDPCTNLNFRKGYLLDGKMMIKVFTDLGFNVNYQQDLTSKELLEVLDEVSMAPHKDDDCFVCVFMTHGNPSTKGKDMIYSKNGPLILESLVAQFNAQNCPSLAGKPKLFFVQACRGYQTDPGAVVEVETDSGQATTKVIPVEADILLSQSSVPGYYSFRNAEKGSVYIRFLACVLALHGNQKEIHWILTEVNSLVANEFLSNSPEHKQYDEKKQMPVFTSMLTKQLILTRKTVEKTA